MTDLTLPEGETYGNGDPAIIGAHFNNMAPKYSDGCSKVQWIGPAVVFEALKQELHRRQASAEQPFSLLDLGTGDGEFARLFKNAHGKSHVTGVDLAENMLEQAKQRGNIDHSVIGNVTDLSWSAASQFDAVSCVGVLDFVRDTENFAKEVTRVLKPGGLFAFTYEPWGTANKGHKTLRHAEKTLSAQFEQQGAKILNILEHPKVYTNFVTKTPVANNVVIGTTPHCTAE